MDRTQSSSRSQTATGMGGSDGTVADMAKERLSEVAGEASQVMEQQMGRLESAIREQPLQAAAIAAGVGIVLGLLARR
jgi:ElaB/YqjD/DUF883 family membrane-anchored ribosome-binding protein